MKNTLFMRVLVFVCLLFVMAGCNRSRLDVDVSDVNAGLKIQRLDRDLFSFPADSLEFYLPQIEKQYGEFLDIYTNRIINIGNPASASYYSYFKLFLTDFIITTVVKDVQKTFPDIGPLQARLENAFRHYRYYFPEKPVPVIVTYISGFNQSVVTSDTLLGIGLDKYLGEKSPYYERLQISKYLRKEMNPIRIPVDAVRAWVNMEFPFNDSINNLIANMIYEGKVQYFIDAMMPSEPDTLKLGYSKKQLLWCEKFEQDMWKYMIDKKLLFENNRLEINRYIGPAPFTTSFGNESPPKTGVFIGWRIVTSYMRNHPEITLQQLMNENNEMSILNLARYKP